MSHRPSMSQRVLFVLLMMQLTLLLLLLLKRCYQRLVGWHHTAPAFLFFGRNFSLQSHGKCCTEVLFANSRWNFNLLGFPTNMSLTVYNVHILLVLMREIVITWLCLEGLLLVFVLLKQSLLFHLSLESRNLLDVVFVNKNCY